VKLKKGKKNIYKTKMKIAILIDNTNHIFTNGIIQQVYFTYLTLKNANLDVIFISTNGKDTFSFLNVPVRIIHNLDKKYFLDIETIIFISSSLTSKTDFQFIKNMNIKMIQQYCGNNYIINQEDFVFDTHKRYFYDTISYVDEIWILPMYTHMKSYIETISKKTVHIVPYIWNGDIVEKYSEINNKKPYQQNFYNSPNAVLIAEPNMSVHKTALVPLVICENYFNKTETPETTSNHKLHKIVNLCAAHGEYAKHFTFKNLNIGKEPNLIEQLHRTPILDVLDSLNKLKCNTLMISHQLFNELNFLHFEMLYLGYPLIHNCKRLESVGFYYPEHNIEIGSEQLEKAIRNFNIANLAESSFHKQYTSNIKKFMWDYSPSNPKNYEPYARLLKKTYQPQPQLQPQLQVAQQQLQVAQPQVTRTELLKTPMIITKQEQFAKLTEIIDAIKINTQEEFNEYKINWDKLKTLHQYHHKNITNIIKQENEKPENEKQENVKGIVMCFGGKNLTLNGIVSLVFIRNKLPNIPIEIYYYGDELNDNIIIDIKQMIINGDNIAFINLSENPEIMEIVKNNKLFNMRGFQIKLFALYYSKFRHVIYFDSDTILCGNITTLLDSLEYKQSGMILWRDIWCYGRYDSRYLDSFLRLSQIYNVNWEYNEYENDSGCIIIDKLHHKILIKLLYYVGVNYHYYFKCGYGDKNYFKFFSKVISNITEKTLSNMYYEIPYNVGSIGKLGKINDEKQGEINFTYCGYSFIHQDQNCMPLFIHNVLGDLTIDKDPSWTHYLDNNKNNNIYHVQGTQKVNNKIINQFVYPIIVNTKRVYMKKQTDEDMSKKLSEIKGSYLETIFVNMFNLRRTIINSNLFDKL
jgi:hypothetical protein